jgi:type II secretory pathway pseudopilin PulG
MKRPVCKTMLTRYSGARPRAGYTMVEILVATALMLTIMLAVAWVFGMVGETIADSRSTLEMTSQLRGVAARLKQELDGVTVTMLPPRDPASNEGYFEITEGAIGPVIPRQVYNPDTLEYQPYGIARNVDRLRVPTLPSDPDQIGYEVDTTVGDFDDILMFTTRGSGEPFIGRCVQKRSPVGAEVALGMDDYDGDGTRDDPYVYNFGTIQSDVAEVAYFVRGRTLYRRVLLVKPDFPQSTPWPWPGNMDTRNDPPLPANPTTEPIFQLSPEGFYNNDVSVRQEWLCINPAAVPPSWVSVMAANTLGDLTKRENRFAHRATVPATGAPAGFPYHLHWWCAGNPAGNTLNPTYWGTHYNPILVPPSTLALYPSPDTTPYEVFIGLGLPTLQECSHPDWVAGGPRPDLGPGVRSPNPVNTDPVFVPVPTVPDQLPLTQTDSFDAWNNPHPYQEQDFDTGSMFYNRVAIPPLDPVEPELYMGPRVGEDVVLTNVIGFDVKVWDPGAVLLPGINANGTPADLTDDGPIPGVALAPGDLGYRLAWTHYTAGTVAVVGMGAYVDLGHGYGTSAFAGPGEHRSQLKRVYDTWSTHYESNWLDSNLNGVKDAVAGIEDLGDENRNGLFDEGTDGIDNYNNGVVDDALEQEAPAPYPVPLRGIQIKIRVFDPASRQVRERTIICDFLPK